MRLITNRMYKENKALIDSIPMFEVLSEQQRILITNSGALRQYEEDQVIIRHGERGSVFYIIKKGECSIQNESGFEFRRQGFGEFFGERALLYSEPRSAT